MSPRYSSPSRSETSREATYRAAMAIPGRFKADGCFVEIVGAYGKVLHTQQRNRRWRRSGGRAS